MKYGVSFKVDIAPEQRDLLESKIKQTLESMGLEPESLFIVLREQPDFTSAVAPANYTWVSR